MSPQYTQQGHGQLLTWKAGERVMIECGALPAEFLCYRQCALVALEDVKAYLTEDCGQIAVSLASCSWPLLWRLCPVQPQCTPFSPHPQICVVCLFPGV